MKHALILFFTRSIFSRPLLVGAIFWILAIVSCNRAMAQWSPSIAVASPIEVSHFSTDYNGLFTIKLSKDYYHPTKVHRIIDCDASEFIYQAEISHWSDADSGRMLINGKELGFRLAISDSWEKRGAEKPLGYLAWNEAKKVLPVGSLVKVLTERDREGGWDRLIVHFWLGDETFCEYMIRNHYSTVYERKGKKKRESIVDDIKKEFGIE